MLVQKNFTMLLCFKLDIFQLFLSFATVCNSSHKSECVFKVVDALEKVYIRRSATNNVNGSYIWHQ